MSVRNLHKQRHFPLQTEFVDEIRKFFPEFLRQKDNPHSLVLQNILERLIELLTFVYDNSVHACKAHSCIRIDIITDQKHLHLITVPGS